MKIINREARILDRERENERSKVVVCRGLIWVVPDEETILTSKDMLSRLEGGEHESSF